MVVEGLAVCDWAVGQASAGHGRAIPPSALEERATRGLAGEEGKGAFCQPWRTAGPLNLEDREPHTAICSTRPMLACRCNPSACSAHWLLFRVTQPYCVSFIPFFRYQTARTN